MPRLSNITGSDEDLYINSGFIKIISILIGVILLCGTVMFTAFTTFETKDHAIENKNDICKRLDGIESEMKQITRFLIKKLGK